MGNGQWYDSTRTDEPATTRSSVRPLGGGEPRAIRAALLLRHPHTLGRREPGRPCPFCPGNEETTPPALETYGPTGRWLVRVVPNLYPAFEGDEPFVVANRGPVFTQATAGGIHEILIFSPEHDATWGMLSEEQTSLVMAALRDRLEEHSQRPNLRYTQAIVNSGREAGASLEHPHGQLLGMSFIPRELAEEQARFARFVGSCLLCTTIEAEEDSGHRVIYADERVVVICPFWSAVPYEMLVIPRDHNPHLHKSPTQDLVAVGEAIRRCLGQLAETGGRRGLQHRVPLGALPGGRALPLARPHLAQGHHDGRLRARYRRGDQRRLARRGRGHPQGVRPGPLSRVRSERTNSKRASRLRTTSRSGPVRPPIPGVFR